jgi:hypothetical protein
MSFSFKTEFILIKTCAKKVNFFFEKLKKKTSQIMLYICLAFELLFVLWLTVYTLHSNMWEGGRGCVEKCWVL